MQVQHSSLYPQLISQPFSNFHSKLYLRNICMLDNKLKFTSAKLNYQLLFKSHCSFSFSGVQKTKTGLFLGFFWDCLLSLYILSSFLKFQVNYICSISLPNPFKCVEGFDFPQIGLAANLIKLRKEMLHSFSWN